MNETILIFTGITKSLPARGRWAASTSRRGGITGLIGENGAGKATLMNLLGGVLKADTGRPEKELRWHIAIARA